MYFGVGKQFPPECHVKRIERYREHKRLFLGHHYDVFERVHNRLAKTQRDILYTSANLAGILCKKSADLLFGESPVYSVGIDDNSPEQGAIERIVRENDLNIINYESALCNAYRGDSFYKIRYGQRYGGVLGSDIDPFRVFIEAQNAEYVFPQEDAMNATQIVAYHIAYPERAPQCTASTVTRQEWIIHAESHYPNRIVYRKFRANPLNIDFQGNVTTWKMYAEITEARHEVETGVPFPLVVHVPNYSTDDTWEGIDDLTELKPMFDELNNRLSLIATILDKHSDPAIVVPAGSMEDGEDGRPIFHTGRDKVFEAMDKNEVVPQYITWDGQLQAAFEEIKTLVDLILTVAEIPPVALGRDNSGTSGASGLSIKFRMQSLLSKINRKRQYYDKGLRHVLLIAQLLEQAQASVDYDVTDVRIKFKDGLPDDEYEQAQIYSIRLGGKPTISQRTAIMHLEGYTEEQAQSELDRIEAEEKATAMVDSSIFNQVPKEADDAAHEPSSVE